MNKRHYEHTLPNIRGSLSNTYDLFHCDCFLKLINHFYGAEKVGAVKGMHQG